MKSLGFKTSGYCEDSERFKENRVETAWDYFKLCSFHSLLCVLMVCHLNFLPMSLLILWLINMKVVHIADRLDEQSFY